MRVVVSISSHSSLGKKASTIFPKMSHLSFAGRLFNFTPSFIWRLLDLFCQEAITLAGVFCQWLSDLAWLIRGPMSSLLMGSRDSEGRGVGGVEGLLLDFSEKQPELKPLWGKWKNHQNFCSLLFLPTPSGWLIDILMNVNTEAPLPKLTLIE